MIQKPGKTHRAVTQAGKLAVDAVLVLLRPFSQPLAFLLLVCSQVLAPVEVGRVFDEVNSAVDGC